KSVVVGATVKSVAASPALQRIPSEAAVDLVRAAQAGQRVVAIDATHAVGLFCTDQAVVAGSAQDDADGISNGVTDMADTVDHQLTDLVHLDRDAGALSTMIEVTVVPV